MSGFIEDPSIDKNETLERLRLEVASLAANLEGMPNHPKEKFIKVRVSPNDPAEIVMSFSHEPTDIWE